MTKLDDQHSANDTLATTRRTVLRTAGLLALAGAGAAGLASCSADAETGAPSATPATTSPPASPSPIADATSPKPSASKAKAPDGPSVVTSEVPVGGGVILDISFWKVSGFIVMRTSAGELSVSLTVQAPFRTASVHAPPPGPSKFQTAVNGPFAAISLFIALAISLSLIPVASCRWLSWWTILPSLRIMLCLSV